MRYIILREENRNLGKEDYIVAATTYMTTFWGAVMNVIARILTLQ